MSPSILLLEVNVKLKYNKNRSEVKRMMEIRYYTSDEVLDMLEEWRANNFEPNYKTLCKRMGITYTYFISWKNGDRVVGEDFLRKIVDFVNEN